MIWPEPRQSGQVDWTLKKPCARMTWPVPLLDEGKTQVISVSAGVQSNDTHRIPGAGIPQLRGRGRGDQIIHFNVETPKHLNKRQKELFKELAEIEGNPIKETLKGFFQKLGI